MKKNWIKQLMFSAALMVSTLAMAQEREYVIVVHGGAGAMGSLEEQPEKAQQYYNALDSALMIGDKILATGGDGRQAVMALSSWTPRSWRAKT